MASAPDVGLAPTPVAAGDWQVIADDSTVSFETRIAFGLIPVRGRFSDLDGELHINSAGEASGELRIAAEKLSTGINRRDRHLRSTDFFAVEQHPHLTFELASLESVSDGPHVTGTLHVRGHAIAIDTPVSVEQPSPNRLLVNADFAVEHRSSGLASTGSGWKKVPETLHAHVALALALHA
jgi:polyisoprenoid-binding protein YceI